MRWEYSLRRASISWLFSSAYYLSCFSNWSSISFLLASSYSILLLIIRVWLDICSCNFLILSSRSLALAFSLTLVWLGSFALDNSFIRRSLSTIMSSISLFSVKISSLYWTAVGWTLVAPALESRSVILWIIRQQSLPAVNKWSLL